MSKKNERVQKLISLDSMLKHQKRKKDGSATFNEQQLQAAGEVIGQILKLDNITKLDVS